MEPLNNIRSQLRLYVDGKIEHAAFRPWMAGVYFDHIAAGKSPALDLCRAIEWELADYSEGLTSEDLLRQSLSGLLGEMHDSHTKAPAVTTVKVIAVGGTEARSYTSSSGTAGIVLPPTSSGSFVPEENLSELRP
jgi:hypothetical protein